MACGSDPSHWRCAGESEGSPMRHGSRRPSRRITKQLQAVARRAPPYATQYAARAPPHAAPYPSPYVLGLSRTSLRPVSGSILPRFVPHPVGQRLERRELEWLLQHRDSNTGQELGDIRRGDIPRRENQPPRHHRRLDLEAPVQFGARRAGHLEVAEDHVVAVMGVLTQQLHERLRAIGCLVDGPAAALEVPPQRPPNGVLVVDHEQTRQRS